MSILASTYSTWRYNTFSALIQAMAPCLTAPSHYLDNAKILLIGPLGTYFSEILNEIDKYAFKKMHLNLSSAKWQTSCLGLNVLNCHNIIIAIGLLMNVLLTYWGRDKMDTISQITFSNAFSWMKMFEYRLRLHWSLYLRVQLTISQHWSR